MYTRAAHEKLFHRLENEVGHILGGLFDWPTVSPWETAGWTDGREFPLINICEDDGAFYAECEMPGIDLGAVDLEVSGRKLTIKGERKLEPPTDGVTHHQRERRHGEFHRVVHLPAEVDSSKVEADYKDGILRVTLPKLEAVKTRKVQINVKKD